MGMRKVGRGWREGWREGGMEVGRGRGVRELGKGGGGGGGSGGGGEEIQSLQY